MTTIFTYNLTSKRTSPHRTFAITVHFTDGPARYSVITFGENKSINNSS